MASGYESVVYVVTDMKDDKTNIAFVLDRDLALDFAKKHCGKVSVYERMLCDKAFMEAINFAYHKELEKGTINTDDE